jgi:hypothetical protein
VKVFISWSGAKSQAVAEALNEWIPDVIQDVKCFFSTESIRAGQQWLSVINQELTDTSFGIICVSADTQHSPWLNFEAGALAKKIANESRVVPLVVDFPVGSLEFPLRQFNAVESSRDGVYAMMKSINETGEPRADAAFNRSFDKWWPELASKLEEIETASGSVLAPEPPNLPSLVQETLDVVKGIARAQSAYFGPSPATKTESVAGLVSREGVPVSEALREKEARENASASPPTSS